MNGLQLQENLKKYTRIEDCPIRNVLSRFSSKWAMLILCVLSENEATRFNTISKAIPDISPKVLTETLKALETDGLVKRKLYAEIPGGIFIDRGGPKSDSYIKQPHNMGIG